MDNKLHKKYGLFTAITMVVGIVIGSGVFFKTESVLASTGGSVLTGILALVIIGCIMLICSASFSILANRYEKVNGLIDYAEALVGERYAYYLGYFMALMYYPTLTCVLAWVSARYTCELFGIADPMTGGACLALAGFYLAAAFAVNSLAPIVAGRIQVSTTLIKLVPLLAVAVIGTAAGLYNGTLGSNFAFHAAGESGGVSAKLLLAACVSTAFSFEGWIVTTSINAELKNARRNLPIALIAGSLIVVAVYVCYYLGITGSVPVSVLLERGSAAAFEQLFGAVGRTVLTAFVVVSCLGTCNGLMLGCVRGIYSLAARGRGIKPQLFASVDPKSDMPANSCIMALLLCSGILFILVTVLGVRKMVVDLLPKNLKIAIPTAVGFFIAYLGFSNTGLAIFEGGSLALGDFKQPSVLLAIITMAIMGILTAYKVKGAILIGIIAGTIISIPMGVSTVPASLFSLPDMGEVGADLVRLTRMQRHLEERHVARSEHLVFGDDLLADGAAGDAHGRADGVLLEVGGQHRVLWARRADDERQIFLCHPPRAEGGEQFFRRLRVLREDEQPRRVAVQPMNKVRLAPLGERGEHRLRIDAALLVRNDDVVVLIENGKARTRRLRGGEIIGDLVPLLERDVRADAHAVDAHVAVFKQRFKTEGRCGADVIGESGEFCVLFCDIHFHGETSTAGIGRRAGREEARRPARPSTKNRQDSTQATR